MTNAMENYVFLISLGLAFCISLALTYGLNRWARRKSLFMDAPNIRKVHIHPIPRIGGIGIILATLTTLLSTTSLSKEIVGIMIGCFILFVVGLIDDLVEIRPRTKFIGQIVACMITISISNIYLKSFGDILGIGVINFPPNVGIPITVIAIIGMINALNFIDGLDGLAAGTSIIALAGFGHLAYFNGNVLVLSITIALIGALFAFLLFNWHPAQVFMGDSGSLCIGFILGFLAVALTQTTNSPVPPVTALLVLGLPVGDTIWVMTRRVIDRSSPFKADQGHLHHKLMNLGIRQKGVVLLMYLWSIGLSWVAILFINTSEHYLFYGYTCGSILLYGLFSIFRGKQNKY